MTGRHKNGGFTVLETLIFLAVTGVLFIIAMVAIGGKNNQVEFATGVRDFNSVIQTTIDEVSNSFFPEKTSYTCMYGGVPGTRVQPHTGSGGTGQGTHEDCIFLGKVLYFDFSGGTTGVKDYSVVTVIGGAQDTQGQDVSSYVKANPVPADSNATLNLTETGALNNGLEVTKILTKDGNGTIDSPAAFGMFISLPQTSSNTESTALAVNTVKLNGSVRGDRLTPETDNAITNFNPVPTDINPTVVICLQHGDVGKKAALFINNQSRQLRTELHIDDVNSTITGVPSIMGGRTC